jgi:hemerythrin-like metal-binding protein
MAHVKWKASLETGNKRVDDEHRLTFELLNELHDGIAAKLDRSSQEEILGKLLSHVAEHFRNEEALMRTTRYPLLADQKRLHKEFLAHTRKLVAEYRAHPSATPLTLEIYIYRWLVNHIRTVDRRMAEYVREREGSETS